MKKRIQAFFMALVMVVTFAASFWGNVAVVRAADLKEGMKEYKYSIIGSLLRRCVRR